MLQASLLAFLVLSDQIVVWQIVVLSVFLGVINGFDMSIRQAFTIEMVDKKDDLSNAIALNSSMVNLARLIGPSAAGILIATVGEGLCFLINAISYGPVLYCLLSMKMHASMTYHKGSHFLLELKTGFAYVIRSSPMRHILFLLGIVSFLGTPYQILMPIFARDIFLGGPQTLSWLVAVAGAGALTGAVYLASRKSIVGLGRIIGVTSGMFGAGLVIFSFSRVFWFSLMVVYAAGFSLMVQMAASNTILQTISDEDKRGRVMSFYTMAFMGMVPFGSLTAGALAEKIGAPWTLCLGGLCCVAASAGFFMQLPDLRRSIRSIYVKKGIIPEVAQGIQSASG